MKFAEGHSMRGHQGDLLLMEYKWWSWAWLACRLESWAKSRWDFAGPRKQHWSWEVSWVTLSCCAVIPYVTKLAGRWCRHAVLKRATYKSACQGILVAFVRPSTPSLPVSAVADIVTVCRDDMTPMCICEYACWQQTRTCFKSQLMAPGFVARMLHPVQTSVLSRKVRLLFVIVSK